MTDRERLLDNYEDALFALMMDELAEQQGQKFLEENERLKHDPAAAIPADVDKRCLRTIKRTFARKQHKELLRIISVMFRKVAVFAFVVMIMYGTAYAAFPDVRVRTLNLLIEMSDVSVSLTLDESGGLESPNKKTEVARGDGILQGYRLPQIPDEFVVLAEGSTSISSWIRYTDNHEKTIYFSIAAAGNVVRSRDLEDVKTVENIQIHGYEGLLIEKGDRIDITWGDTERNNFLSVVCTGFERDTALQFAEGLEFVKQ